MASIFLILNEAYPKGVSMPVTEVVNPARWTYQDALDDLSDIASDAGVVIDGDESSVFLPTKGTHLESDEYYIIELEVSDRG